jgi:DmsE family decaheme c-type cytochrome
MAPRDVADTCTTCHNRSTHAFWKGSIHDSRNMSCITCHSVHSPKSERAQLKQTSEVALCGACHRPEAQKITRTAHMPLMEGKMTCSSCHNPHGSANVRQLRTGNWINESCIACHTEKRGPFLWEHAPGKDSCVNCHDPHGSSNDRMLVSKLPMLCQRCHIGTRHPSTIYDFTNVRRNGVPSNRIYGRGCVNCHANIHGSNHPSGNAFLR